VSCNAHFPTDLNLLWDASRKVINLAEWFRDKKNQKGFRKSKSWLRDIKRLFRIASKTAVSGGANKEERIQNDVRQYLDTCRKVEKKAIELSNTLALTISCPIEKLQKKQLDYFIEMQSKHIDLVDRRLLQKQTIPHEEKLFSIFENHAEWLYKGKSTKPITIGHNVLIATDQFNFVLHQEVLIHKTDSQSTKHLGDTLTSKYPGQIRVLSLDKGFYSKENKEYIKAQIQYPVMPKKGKCTKEEYTEEHENHFIKYRNKHSAVESNINQLRHNSLSHCPDKGITNFKKYVAMGVLAYNIHKLGEHLQARSKPKKVA
jgi:transposase, IS5 family